MKKKYRAVMQRGGNRRTGWIEKVTRHAVVLAAGMLAFAGLSIAQEGVIEEVIVTGSRIARDANLTGALPVQSMDADDIATSGEFSLADVVNDVPALLSSITAEQSIDRAGRHGSNRLNLRGLGQNRTLVLVDGRRHVGGLQGSSAVDIGSSSWTKSGPCGRQQTSSRRSAFRPEFPIRCPGTANRETMISSITARPRET